MFEINDRVHCTFNDKDGIVTALENPESNTFPVCVTFDDSQEDVYTIDGKWNDSDNEACLTKL